MAALVSPGQANSMDQTILSEETLNRIVPDQAMPLDALGYLGGLFEARFYQPHSTTDDPRDEIQEAASLYVSILSAPTVKSSYRTVFSQA
jgi:hypothetical protein